MKCYLEVQKVFHLYLMSYLKKSMKRCFKMFYIHFHWFVEKKNTLTHIKTVYMSEGLTLARPSY